jgi:hypothetical protein
MKKLLNISVLFIVLLKLGFAQAPRKQPLPLRQDTRDSMKANEKEFPHLALALLPDHPVGTPVPLNVVPKEVQDYALRWVKKILQPVWLPADIDQHMSALKDAKIWEGRDAQGRVFSKLEGDYLLFDYEINGFGFHIQESGESVAVRIDFPDEADLKKQPIAQAEIWLQKFFTITDAAIADQKLKVEDRVGLWQIVSQKKPSGKVVDGYLRDINWWEPINLLSDGRSLFAYFGEGEPGRAIQARLGPPNRF